MEDTLPGSQPAPALWSEPGAPGLVQPGQGGAWGHLTAAPSAYEGLSGSRALLSRACGRGQGTGEAGTSCKESFPQEER